MVRKRMKLLIELCGLFLSVALSRGAHAGRLYSNGGLNPQPITESGMTAPVPGGAWSELQHDSGVTSLSNSNLGSSGTTGNRRIADDFVVPIGETWPIDAIDLYGIVEYASAKTPFVTCNVQIWDGRPGEPGAKIIAGDLVTNRLASSTDTKIFRTYNSLYPPGWFPRTTLKVWRNHVTFSPKVTLPPGTYWLEWQSTATASGDTVYPPVSVPGKRSLVGWNARQYDVATATWKDLIDAGSPLTMPYLNMDMPFELYSSDVAVCGDGAQESPEQCDDGNNLSGDGCDANCTLTACGNGVNTAGETCDDGNLTDGDGCDTNCTPTACGNGVKTTGEECDDGNRISGDGCDANCTRTGCGNHVKTKGEECDDGNRVDGDGCSMGCKREVPQDEGQVDPVAEPGCTVGGSASHVSLGLFFAAVAAVMMMFWRNVRRDRRRGRPHSAS